MPKRLLDHRVTTNSKQCYFSKRDYVSLESKGLPESTKLLDELNHELTLLKIRSEFTQPSRKEDITRLRLIARYSQSLGDALKNSSARQKFLIQRHTGISATSLDHLTENLEFISAGAKKACKPIKNTTPKEPDYSPFIRQLHIIYKRHSKRQDKYGKNGFLGLTDVCYKKLKQHKAIESIREDIRHAFSKKGK